MNDNVAVIAVLAALNAFQLFYWSIQTHRLVDKVMSKDYHSYQQSLNPPKPTVQIKVEDATQDDLSQLKEFGA